MNRIPLDDIETEEYEGITTPKGCLWHNTPINQITQKDVY